MSYCVGSETATDPQTVRDFLAGTLPRSGKGHVVLHIVEPVSSCTGTMGEGICEADAQDSIGEEKVTRERGVISMATR